MGQTVYVDLYFLINFSMDFLCLFLTAKLLNHTLSPLRGILAGAVGGVYANLALFLPWGWLGGLLADLAVGGVMCVITFGKRGRWHSMPLYILVFGAVSMALGGVMTALFHLLNRVPLPEGTESVEGDGISVWVFAVLALISGGITLFGGRFFAGRATEETAEIELCYEGQTVRLCAMTDSGNLLREPISGKPCIVADLDAVSAILPEEILRAARLGAERGMATLTGGALRYREPFQRKPSDNTIHRRRPVDA